MDLTYIEGYSMLAGGDGEKIVLQAIDDNISDDDDLEKWVVIQGCMFDPATNLDQMQNFIQNEFKVTFFDLINPSEENKMFQFKIEVFKEWDSENNESSGVLAKSDSLMLGVLRAVPIFILQDGSESE